jgi:hypothetical protein
METLIVFAEIGLVLWSVCCILWLEREFVKAVIRIVEKVIRESDTGTEPDSEDDG